MARQRNKEHQGLPTRWRKKGEVYYYLVPKGQEDKWDNKTEFRLGASQSEAHRTFAGRLAASEGVVKPLGNCSIAICLKLLPLKASELRKMNWFI